MRRFHGIGVLLLLVVASLPGVAHSAGTISGRVRTLAAPQSPIAGALVTVAAPDQPPATATTGSDGRFSIGVGGNGPYSLDVHAAGFAGYSTRGVQPGTHNVSLEPATFMPLPVNGTSLNSLAADATSGVFYMSAGRAPELYRSHNYGGSWQPVTMRYEDLDTGLNKTGRFGEVLATTGVPGEVAVITTVRNPTPQSILYQQVQFSTDYGVTWRTVQGLLSSSRQFFLYWGHASPTSPSVLMAAIREEGTWRVWRAHMAAATPAFVQEGADPFGQGSAIAGADSTSGSFIGRLSSPGELSFAPLTPPPTPLVFGAPEATGLPTPGVMLRLGGRKQPAAPPDGALVVGGAHPTYTAQFLTKDVASFVGASASAPTAIPSACNFLPNPEGIEKDHPPGSVAPTSTGTAGLGNIGQSCWVTKSGTAALSFAGGQCFAPGKAAAYDRNWGAGNHVLLCGGVNGPLKYARLDASGVPEVDLAVMASAGPAPNSGGLSIQGLASPSVEDTAYGPAGAQQRAVSSMYPQLSLASQDGGQTFVPVVSRGSGGSQVRWWQGASGRWLVFGIWGWDAPIPYKLSAVLDWDGASALSGPNVVGSRAEDLGGADYGIHSLHEVPGSDTLFIGLGKTTYPAAAGGRLYRARIVPGNPPSLTDVVDFGPVLGGTPLYLPHALAYCPTSAADPNIRDVLFVATGAFSGEAPLPFSEHKGSLLRITGATTGAPVVSEISSVPHGTERTGLFDVRADCVKGNVYTGGQSTRLYKSTDAGFTFSPITITNPDGTPLDFTQWITAIGLNPVDPNPADPLVNDVKVGAAGGLITQSTDGGASWTIVNDPEVHRPITVKDIEFPPPGGGLKSFRPSAAPSRRALVGASSGVFSADLAVDAGVIGVAANVGGGRRTESQITSLGSDGHPVVVTGAAPKSAFAVFRRANGLSFVSNSGGSWSLPLEIPGTTGADSPAVALDRANGLNVVFARSGRPRGIYVLRRTPTGVWSTPRRLSRATDSRPRISITGTRTAHVVFSRTRGRTAGLYLASARNGRWTTPRRIPGTRRGDVSPSLETFAGRVHLAFARTRRGGGIYYATRSGSRWSLPRRLTRGRDSQPTLAMDQSGARHIVFRRVAGKRGGLFALRGTKRWSVLRVPGTNPKDLQPALSTSGATIVLAFVRPSGRGPGVYYDSRRPNGRWLPAPRRWSRSANDRNPSLDTLSSGRLTIVFERA